MSCRIDAAELLTYRAAKLYDQGGLEHKALMKPASMAKLASTETANFCANATVSIMGGERLTKAYARADPLSPDPPSPTPVRAPYTRDRTASPLGREGFGRQFEP